MLRERPVVLSTTQFNWDGLKLHNASYFSECSNRHNEHVNSKDQTDGGNVLVSYQRHPRH